MKKTFLFLVVAISVASAFSSCKKCYTCNFGANGGQQKYCNSDFPDKGYVKQKHDLDLTIQAFENNGYTCVAD